MSSTILPFRPGALTAMGKDRRRSPREKCMLASTLAHRDDPEDSREVLALDMSRHGVGFQLHDAITIGESYVMEIGFGPQSLNAEVQVISCRKLPNGRYAVGAEFC
jgi:hypothetical protein